MKKKNKAVHATALAPIGADPVREFIKTLPGTAQVLACKGSRFASKQVISIAYSVNGKFIHQTFSTEGGAA